jgi:hypothetical protein
MVFNSKNDLKLFETKINNFKTNSILPTEFTNNIKQNQDENQDKKGSKKGSYDSLMDLLKEHLTCELYDASLKLIDTPHIVLKVFLGLFILAANALNAYMTVGLIMTYLNYEVISTSRTIYETPLEFPMITICNPNPFTSLFGSNYVNQFFSASSVANLSYSEKRDKIFPTKNKLLSFISNSNDSTKKIISHGLQDILIECRFNFQRCTSADFSWVFDKIYGNCYKFNSGFNATGHKVNLKTSSLSGFSYGLQLDLYVNYHQNLSFFNSIVNGGGGGMGAILRINNVTNVIDQGAHGIFAAAGFYTSISLSRENKLIMKRPYSDCVLDNDFTTSFDSDIYNTILASNFSYSQQFCVMQCIQKYAIQTCGCSHQFLESVFQSNKCSNLSVIAKCARPAFFYAGSKDYITEYCLPLCPLECNSTRFTYDTSVAKLEGDIYVDIIQNNPNLSADFVTRQINAETVSSSIAKVNVFYESLSYVKTEESPALDIVTLIANMGGTWGLFLSLNFFSLGEIITALIELFYYKTEKNFPTK